MTLSQFLPDDWTLVTQKKKKGKIGRPPVASSGTVRAARRASPPIRGISEIRADKSRRLNSILGLSGPDQASGDVGRPADGYEAHRAATQIGPVLAGFVAQPPRLNRTLYLLVAPSHAGL